MSPAKNSVLGLLIGTLVVTACNARRMRITNARNEGNEPLAACFEACKPDDDACVSTCEREHPTGWRHHLGAAIKPVVDVGNELQVAISRTMHPLAVADARALGNEPLAACYEACEPTATDCMSACEKQHERPEDVERRREMFALVTTAVLHDQQKARENKRAWEASNGPSNDPNNRTGGSWGGSSSSGSSSGTSSSSSGGSSSKSSGSSSGGSGPPANIHFGKSCSQCDYSLKNGLGCTFPTGDVCGLGEPHTGAGFCVARPTDQGGSCSARCKSTSDCPGGYTCGNLGTGLSVCAR